jgi:hypothetical protein
LPKRDEAGQIGLWDLTTGKVISVFSSELGADSLAFSGDGQLLASGGEHGVMLFDTAIHLERGRIETRTRVDSVAFDRAGPRLAFARAREPSATTGDGGLDKLFDPFFVAATMLAKDAISSGVLATGGGGKSVTGGSAVEVWNVRQRKSPEVERLWDAIRLSTTRADEARKAVEHIIVDFPSLRRRGACWSFFRRAPALVGRNCELAEAAVKARSELRGLLPNARRRSVHVGRLRERDRGLPTRTRTQPRFGPRRGPPGHGASASRSHA